MHAGAQQRFEADVVKVPFHALVQLNEVVAHPGWAAAMKRALEALAKPGVVVITGGEGSGKTLLMQALARALNEAGRKAVLLGSGIPSQAGKPEIVLVDEAHRLSGGLLRALAGKAACCVFAGPPSLLDQVEGLAVEHVVLAPLSPAEVGPFLATQLARAHQPADLLHPDAVAALAWRSAGVPRRLQLLAGLAIFMARLENADQVTRAHVDQADEVQNGTTLENDEQDAWPDDDADSAPGAGSAGHAHSFGTLAPAASRADAGPGGPASWAAAFGGARRPTKRAAVLATCCVVAIGAIMMGRLHGFGAGGGTANVTAAPPPVMAGAAPASGMLAGAPGEPEHDTVAPPGVPRTPPARPVRQSGFNEPLPLVVNQSAFPSAGAPQASARFQGPIDNETMHQRGQFSVVISREGPDGSITARIRASDGLLGTGTLSGTLTGNGRITASGPVMVGKNPFICDLRGVIAGGTLTGSAEFTRSGGGSSSHSSFVLSKS